jgi:DNA-binding PadR family transcriptional regulator
VSLPHVLLGLLHDAPQTGYDLERMLRSELDPVWSAGFSQIYPELSRLRRRGWVLLRVLGPRRGPRRNLYRVTAAGRRELARWLGEAPAAPRGNDPLLVRLALLGGLPAGVDRRRAVASAETVLAEEVRRLRKLAPPEGYRALARKSAIERLEGLRRFLRARAPSGESAAARARPGPRKTPGPRKKR